MDEIWERAVETALEGQTDVASVRSLTLDGAVKCVQGRLPPPSLFEKYHNLQYFSIANIGVSSLEQFPRLQNLQKLSLSDNRIAGGLEFLVEAGLQALRDLDLSNNRIQDINDLRPLAELHLVSLDLYECPVTRVKDYRSQVFGLIRSLKYLDKMDADENERPESEDEEEDDADEEEDDPGSGEIDGEERPSRLNNGHRAGNDDVVDVVDVDEDESDADEEETETSRGPINGVRQGDVQHQSNGYINGVDYLEEDEEDNESGDEIDEEEGDDEDVVEVLEIEDSDDEEDGVEDDDDDNNDDEEDEEEEVDNEDGGEFAEPDTTGRLTSTEGEIDGHEQGEDEDDDDDIGETGEEEDHGVDGVEFEDEEDAEDEEEDHGAGYLVQPVGQVELDGGGGESDMDPDNEDIEDDDDAVLAAEEDEEDEDDGEVQELPPSSSSLLQKRKRDGEEDNNDDDDDDGSSGGDDDDEVNHVVVQPQPQPSKNRK